MYRALLKMYLQSTKYPARILLPKVAHTLVIKESLELKDVQCGVSADCRHIPCLALLDTRHTLPPLDHQLKKREKKKKKKKLVPGFSRCPTHLPTTTTTITTTTTTPTNSPPLLAFPTPPLLRTGRYSLSTPLYLFFFSFLSFLFSFLFHLFSFLIPRSASSSSVS